MSGLYTMAQADTVFGALEHVPPMGILPATAVSASVLVRAGSAGMGKRRHFFQGQREY